MTNLKKIKACEKELFVCEVAASALAPSEGSHDFVLFSEISSDEDGRLLVLVEAVFFDFTDLLFALSRRRDLCGGAHVKNGATVGSWIHSDRLDHKAHFGKKNQSEEVARRKAIKKAEGKEAFCQVLSAIHVDAIIEEVKG